VRQFFSTDMLFALAYILRDIEPHEGPLRASLADTVEPGAVARTESVTVTEPSIPISLPCGARIPDMSISGLRLDVLLPVNTETRFRPSCRL
jgi:hypothetical protein